MAIGSLQQDGEVIGANEIMSSSTRRGEREKPLATSLVSMVIESGSHSTLETTHFPAKESLLRKGHRERERDSCAWVGKSDAMLILVIHRFRNLSF